jgi:hypothetical protein
MRRRTLEEKEKQVHGFAYTVARGFWGFGDRLYQAAAKISSVADRLDQIGHDAMDVANRYSERHRPHARFPVLRLTKHLTEFSSHGLPPIVLTNGRGRIDLGLARRVYVTPATVPLPGSAQEYLERNLPITDEDEGTVDISLVATLPVGDYELLIEWQDGKTLVLDNKIEVAL